MIVRSIFKNYPFVPLLVIAIGITGVIQIFSHRAQQTLTPESVAAIAESNLHEQERYIQIELDHLAAIKPEQSQDSIFVEYFKSRSKDQHNLITYYGFVRDSLFAWSDNNVFFSQQEADLLQTPSLSKLRNGWYEVFKKSTGDVHFYATLLIKNEYAYQNKFLANKFNPQLRIPSSYNLTSTFSPGAAPVKNSFGKALFYIVPGETVVSEGHISSAAWLYIVVLLFVLASVYSIGRKLLGISTAVAGLFAAMIVGLRMLMIHYRIPAELYKSELFNPALYASYIYMNSLGDFLLNALLVLCIVMMFVRPLRGAEPRGGFVSSFILLFVVIAATVFLNILMQGLVINSNINFNTTNVFDLNKYSFIGLFIIAVLMFTYFLLVKKLAWLQSQTLTGTTAKITVLVAAMLIGIFSHSILPSAFFILLYLSISYNLQLATYNFTLSSIILFLVITSLYSSATIYMHSKEKEMENRKVLAGKIESEQDRIAEHLFEDLQNKMSVDTTLLNYFNDPLTAAAQVNQRLHRRYFNGYWTKYEVTAYCFDSLDESVNKSLDSSVFTKFQMVIANEGKPTYADDLFFLTNAKGKSMYLARVALFESDSIRKGTLFIELEPKIIQATSGFPELFISDKVIFNKDLANYSYAKYKSNELVNQYGDFPYYTSSSIYGQPVNEFIFIKKDGYSHLLYRPAADNLIVVSRKDDTAYALLTEFSYFLGFFSALLLIFFLLKRFNRLMFANRRGLTLQSRIQISVIAIVVFSATMIGAGTIYYIIKKYDNNQSVRISGQLNNLLVTIENNLSDRLNPDTVITEDVIYRLSRLSNYTATDFNWYDQEGNLLFSSQPKIYDQGITSTLMNPIAFHELTDGKKTRFVQPENVGRLNYVAAYQSLHNRQNQLLGYISLPFFEKESELNRDISTFLSALINIYVLLLLVAILVTFFIASLITKPLLLIQEKLANINLGKRNEFIQWENEDEIGALVKEYNKKVEQLAISADLLAKSERESAWQEMAKQVAHEIKNPLTPMKLGVQHLLSAYNNNSPDKEELVKKISHTLIQQIDTLTNIANEFSHFAKMPRAKNEVVDVAEILSDTINLFKETPGVDIFFNVLPPNAAEVLADKEQLIRVFSNLLKNAIQSIPDGRHGKIKVTVSREPGAGDRESKMIGSDAPNSQLPTPYLKVSVTDNGTGIADNQAEKIFTPNFTTKSGGMGLGLSIVKNIVENLGGKVGFFTQVDHGSTFFVTLPALDRNTPF